MKNRTPFHLLAITGLFMLAAALMSCKKSNSNNENVMPHAVIIANTNRGVISTVFQFDGSTSSDKEDPITSLQAAWNFGDSVAAFSPYLGYSSKSGYTPYTVNKITSHTFNRKGIYYVCMLMKDTKGLADTAKVMITVVDSLSNRPPSIPIYSAPINWTIWLPTSVKLIWSCTDPENDPLTYDIYLGLETLEPKLIVTGITAQEYTLPNLHKGETYNWRIGVHDPNGNYVLGDVWRFSTQP